MPQPGGPDTDPARPDARCAAVGSLELRFPSCPEYLALLRLTASWYARRCGFSEKECGRIVLALVEAVTNIIRHAYSGDENQSIMLRLAERDGGIELELIDQGKSVPPGDLEKKVRDQLEPGGLGVRMMKSCMDHFHYEPRPGGGARLVLRKLRGQTGKEAKP